MARIKGLAGYIVPTNRDIPKLAEIYGDLAEGLPLLCYEDETWYLKFSDPANPDLVYEVPQGTGKMVSIPAGQSPESEYSLSGSGNITIDFDLGESVVLTLTGPATIQLVNMKLGKPYYLSIINNNHAILNSFSFGKYPKNVPSPDWTENRVGTVFSLIYLNQIYAVGYYQSSKVRRTSFKPNTGTPIARFASTPVDIVGTLAQDQTGSYTVFDSAFYFDTPADNTEYSISSYPDNYTVSMYVALKSYTEGSGSLVSIKNDNSGLFWIYYDADNSYIRVWVYTDTEQLSFDIDTSEWYLTELHHVVLAKTLDYVKVLVDGNVVYGERLIGSNNTVSGIPLTLGHLRSSPGLGSLGSLSFGGYLSHIEFASTVDNFYEYAPVARPIGSKNSEFLVKYSDLSLLNVGSSVTAITQQSVDTINNPQYDLGLDGGSDFLGSAHSVRYNGAALDSVTDNFTVEAIIYNPTGNSRGTIVCHSRSAAEINWHLGIYDGNLRLNIDNSTYVLNGSSLIPIDTTVVVAAVFSGNDIRLYVDGALDYSGTLVGTPNYMAYTSNGTDTSIDVCLGPGQNNVLAVPNTSLYPSKSLLTVKNIAIRSGVDYTLTSTTESNYMIPQVLGGRQAWV